MTMNKLAISLAMIMVLGSVPFVFSESLRSQLDQGLEINQIVCSNSNHILVERTKGNLACVTEKLALKTGWKIISQTNLENESVKQVKDKLEINDRVDFSITNQINTVKQSQEVKTVKENITLEIQTPNQNEPKLILNPENFSELIPRHTVLDYSFDVTVNRDEFAEGMAKILDDTILEVSDNKNGFGYITEKGLMTFLKGNGWDILKTSKFEYKLLYANAVPRNQIDILPQKIISYMGIELNGTESIDKGIGQYVDSWRISQKIGDLQTSNSVFILFDPMYTSIRLGEWNDNFDEIKFFDPSTAIQNAEDYIFKFDVLTEGCHLRLVGYNYSMSIEMINGSPLYKIREMAECFPQSTTAMSFPYSVYLDAVTGEPLFVLGSQHENHDNSNHGHISVEDKTNFAKLFANATNDTFVTHNVRHGIYETTTGKIEIKPHSVQYYSKELITNKSDMKNYVDNFMNTMKIEYNESDLKITNGKLSDVSSYTSYRLNTDDDIRVYFTFNDESSNFGIRIILHDWDHISI